MPRVQTYQDLEQSVAQELARPDRLGQCPEWIEQAESDLVIRLRDLRENELETSGLAMVGGQDYILLPDGVRELRAIRLDTSTPRTLDNVSIDMLTNIAASGSGLSHPSSFTWQGEKKVRIAPTPVGADAYTIFYYGGYSESSAAKTTSQVLKEYPMLLKYGAAYFGAIFLQDNEAINRYGNLYEKAIQDYGKFLGRVKLGGGPLAIRPDVKVNDAHKPPLSG